jgi:hypothetical protein
VAFVASSVLASIDDDPPRLVVWAGTIQFVVTVLITAIGAWRNRVASHGREDGESDVGAMNGSS